MAPTPLPALSTVVVEPIQSVANSWLKCQLSGVLTPGTIAPGGLKGFRRETGWDVKKGKGTKGATLTIKDQPPVEGLVTLQLVTAQDFSDWDLFVSSVLSIDPESQAADGLSWFYPGHVSIGLTDVVVKHYTGVEYHGRGLYHATFELLEWSPPPDASIVRTVAATAPDEAAPDAVPTEDPRIVALEAQIAAQIAAASQAASQAAEP